MAKCIKCGKWGFFLRLENGVCSDCCAEAVRLEAEQKAEALRKAEEDRRLKEMNDPSNLLDKITRSIIPRAPMHQGLPMVYSYVIHVSEVNRSALYEKARLDDFNVTLSLSASGNVVLSSNDVVIAQTDERKQMISDWLRRGDPYICQFTRLKKDEEAVILHLYRDDESRLKDCKMTIAKLTAYSSCEKQDNIMLLEAGQKLFMEDDDNGKWYVRDINYHDIGKLPAKINRMFEDDTLRGMFFDHAETTENANGDVICVPFVRFYHD